MYLDLSKVFDTLDHVILLHKLNHYDVTNAATQLIQSFRENSKHILNISTRVPHGSVIGPLVFLVYLNDLQNDTTLYCFIQLLGRF